MCAFVDMILYEFEELRREYKSLISWMSYGKTIQQGLGRRLYTTGLALHLTKSAVSKSATLHGTAIGESWNTKPLQGRPVGVVLG